MIAEGRFGLPIPQVSTASTTPAAIAGVTRKSLVQPHYVIVRKVQGNRPASSQTYSLSGHRADLRMVARAGVAAKFTFLVHSHRSKSTTLSRG
jgi:hypothetical protein